MDNTNINSISDLHDEKLSPSEYFDAIKGLKNNITDEALVKVYENCLEILNKYKATGQWKGAKKLIFHLETIEKEREIVKLGINTFVYKDDIEAYISNVASDVVKIIDLESYEREIPDEIVSVIEKVRDKFDQLYVVFTDYTGEHERKVAKERREKDPILFGAFKDKSNSVIIDRFYYLGDWVDEYCDLTLDKMVNECEKVGKRNITHSISTPEDIEEFKKQLRSYNSINTLTISGNLQMAEPAVNTEVKPGFFAKVKTFFTGRKNES